MGSQPQKTQGLQKKTFFMIGFVELFQLIILEINSLEFDPVFIAM
jgi:hypothetical protein